MFDASGLKNDSNVTVLKAAVDKLKIQSILLLLAHSCSLVGAKSAVELLQDYGAFAALPDWLKVLFHPLTHSLTHSLTHVLALKNKPWNYYFYSPSHGGSIIPNGAASPDPSKFLKDYSLSQNVRAVTVDNTFTNPQYVDGLTDAEKELAKMIWNHSERYFLAHFVAHFCAAPAHFLAHYCAVTAHLLTHFLAPIKLNYKNYVKDSPRKRGYRFCCKDARNTTCCAKPALWTPR